MQQERTGQRVAVVLGMHRSGTSMLASLLGRLGVALGSSLVPPDGNNPAGYWEHAEIVALHERLLGLLDRAWIGDKGTLPYPAQWWSMPEVQPLRGRLVDVVRRELTASDGLWGFKDPRTARLLPLWRSIFAELRVEPLYLLALRNPAAVTASVVARDHIPAVRAELLWLQHNLDALRYTRGSLSAVIDYDRWFSQPDAQARAVVDALGPGLDSDDAELAASLGQLVNPDLRHHRGQTDSNARLPYVGELYRLLTRAAEDGVLPDAVWDIAERADEAQSLLHAWLEGLPLATSPGQARPPVRADTGTMQAPASGHAVPDSRPLQVCIVSDDLVGPVRNGGIGTAYTALAEALAGAGHQVTLLYTLGDYCETRTIEHWVEHYADKGIRFVPLPGAGERTRAGSAPLAVTHDVYQWLRGHSFDVIHFPEWRGRGYYTVLARHQGLAFADTRIVIGVHSPTSWHREGSNEYADRVDDLETDFMERQCVAFADAVVSPSRYMLDWLVEQGWELPARHYAQPNILPLLSRGGAATATPAGVSEIVFFGRLETRKGLSLFCDAVDRLADVGAPPSLTVTFLGKSGLIDGVSGRDYVRGRAREWPVRCKTLCEKDHAGAIHYLSQPGRVAVIASLIDNSPYTVLECLGAGIPFLASRVGGIPELIAEAELDAVCFEVDAASLASHLQRVLSEGARPARPAMDIEAVERAWVAWHQSLCARAQDAPAWPPVLEREPLVSVCMAHFNRPRFLKQALESIQAQDYPQVEVVLVDDGSTDPEAVAFLDALQPLFDDRGWQLVRQENRYLGAARNAAARHARGEYLLFMDDDNCAKPHEVSTFVAAAQRSGADILTCLMDRFTGDEPPASDGAAPERWLPLGGSLLVGMFRNCFGDANALVRRDAFRSVGGFTEDYGVGHEDWEFFAQAVMRGLRLELVPEALFWYRVTEGSMLGSTRHYGNHMRSLRPYADALPPALRPLMPFALGLKFRTDDLSVALARARQQVQLLQAHLAGQAEAQPSRKESSARRRTGRAPRQLRSPAPQTASAVPGAPPADAYPMWRQLHAPRDHDEQLLQEHALSWHSAPVIHFLVRLQEGQVRALSDTIEALSAQLYGDWRLTVVADMPAPDPMFEQLEVLSWVQLAPQDDVLECINARATETVADWVVWIGSGDRPAPRFTFAAADAANRHPAWRFVYTDEDRIDGEGQHTAPQFKPDFNLDLLRSAPYVGNSCLVRRDALTALGGYSALPGAELYDLCLRVLDASGAASIGHVDDVLYYRAVTNERLDATDARERSSRQALERHLQRAGARAHVGQGLLPGSHFVDYQHDEQPLVSIIIPTRDQRQLLEACISSLLTTTTYRPLELIVVDNASSEPDAVAYLDALPSEHSNVRVLRYPHSYNFSAMNNLAAREARGEYLLLLNNDTVTVQPHWLDRMMSHAQRREVGVVGARLVFPDHRLQHAGVILGMGANGIAEHPLLGLPMTEAGYAGRAQLVQNFSAVTGACLLIRKSVFTEARGLDEDGLKVLYNDIDLCLKVRSLGYLIVWTPYATVVHYGSASLNAQPLARKARERAEREVALMLERWLPELTDDPSYNRNLSLNARDYSCAAAVNPRWQHLPRLRPRILALAAGSDGSWEHRVRIPLDVLERDSRAHTATVPKYRDRVRVPSVTELARAAPDVLLLHNTVHDVQMEAIERYRRFKHVFKVFGQDDLMYALPPSNPYHGMVYKDMKKRLRRCMNACDRLIVTTEALAEAYHKMAGDVRIVPNYLDWARWEGLHSQRRQGRRPRVGWAGAQQHAGDLQLLLSVVEQTADEVEWVFFGLCFEELLPYVAEVHDPVPFDEYPAKLASLDLDLALAPLEHNRFNETKSNLKLLEYGVLGLPVVCSDITPYRSAPVERVANNPRAWLSAIRARVHDPAAAEAEGDRLRRWVMEHWLLQAHLGDWMDALVPGKRASQTPTRTTAGRIAQG